MASVAVTEDIKRGRNQLAVTVVLGHTVKHIYNSGLQSVMLAVIKDDLGLSGTQFGFLATSQRVTSGATTMVAGYLGDRFANRSGLMLMLSLGIMGVSYYLLGSAPSYWLLFAVMLLVGIGPSLYHPPAIASLSRKFPDKRGFAISLHGTGGSIGEVVGPVLTGGLISGTYLVAFHWRDVLHLSVFPALFFAVAVYLMMRNIPAAAADAGSLREYGSSLATLLRRRAMLSLVLVTALRSSGQSAVMGFLPVYLLEDLKYEKVEIGLFMSGAQVTGIVAQPLMGYLSDRFGRKIVLVPCTLAMGLLIISLRFAETGASARDRSSRHGSLPVLASHYFHSGSNGRGPGSGAVHGGITDIRGQLFRSVLAVGGRLGGRPAGELGVVHLWRRAGDTRRPDTLGHTAPKDCEPDEF